MNIGWALLHASHSFIRAKVNIYCVWSNVLRAGESCEQERTFCTLSVQKEGQER